MRALHTAATGMMAQELNVQVISNNIANMRTTGYKRQRAAFQDLLYEHVRRVGTQTSDQGNILPVGIELGSGVKTRRHAAPDDAGHADADRQGTRRRHPRRRLLQDPAARRPHRLYPRRLVRDRRAGPHRHRTTAIWSSPASPSRRTPTGVTISAQGQVHGDAAGPTTPTSARPDRARRASSTRPACKPIGDNLFIETAASGAPQDGIADTDGFGDLQQGYLEQANVEAVTRNLRPDRRPARLRDERQGHHRRRPDAVGRPPTCSAEGLSHDPRTLLVAALLAVIAAVASARRPRTPSAAPPRRCCAPTSPSPATSCASATWSTTPASPPTIADLPRARPRHHRHVPGRARRRALRAHAG